MSARSFGGSTPRRTLSVLTTLAFLLCADRLCAEITSAPKILAQSLIPSVMAQNPELLVFGVHAVAPGSAEHKLIACSKVSIIGEADDADDTAAAVDQKSIIAPNVKDGRIEILLPLKAASGEVVGAGVFVYNYREGDDQARLYQKSVAIRDGLKAKIASVSALFTKTG